MPKSDYYSGHINVVVSFDNAPFQEHPRTRITRILDAQLPIGSSIEGVVEDGLRITHLNDATYYLYQDKFYFSQSKGRMEVTDMSAPHIARAIRRGDRGEIPDVSPGKWSRSTLRAALVDELITKMTA